MFSEQINVRQVSKRLAESFNYLNQEWPKTYGQKISFRNMIDERWGNDLMSQNMTLVSEDVVSFSEISIRQTAQQWQLYMMCMPTNVQPGINYTRIYKPHQSIKRKNRSIIIKIMVLS